MIGLTVLEVLRRDWDVAVLDAWAEEDPGARMWTMQPYVAGFCACVLLDQCEETVREFGDINAAPSQGLTVARERAAAAVFPALSETKQSELGVRP